MTILDRVGAKALRWKSLLGRDIRAVRNFSGTVRDRAAHIRAGLEWIFRAHDATGDGGVSRSYEILYHPYFRKQGWLASYPETTGYIIPSLYNCSSVVGSVEARPRAFQMALWETQVQLDSGAVQGGMIGEGRSPAIFNTGQALFGLLRSFRETQDVRLRDAAYRAAEFLVDQQDPDGNWRKSMSKFSYNGGLPFRTYNVGAAWGLLEAGLDLESERFVEAAERNLRFTLTQQTDVGWFKANCLTDPSAPLLHTIAYAIRGVLECGLGLKREEAVDAAVRAARAVARTRRSRTDGFSGRFDEYWTERATWSCLTGEAQMAIVWGKAGLLVGDSQLVDEMRLTNERLRRLQYHGTGRPGLDGGLAGSEPVSGDYGSYEVLSWAVKFFIDAQLMEHLISEHRPLAEVRAVW